MTPLIGITSSFESNEQARPKDSYRLRMRYPEAIALAGGNSVMLPVATEDTCEELLRRLDGLILSGGPDIPCEVLGAPPHPSCHYMSIEKWRSEILWLQTARKIHLPILGICLGMQVMNVVAGGTIIQDIPTQCPDAHRHAAPDEMHQHEVTITDGSKLATLLCHCEESRFCHCEESSTKQSPTPATVTITSAHHQAIDKIGEGYKAVATSPDGLIEAIESIADEPVLGVQWHPERCLDQPNWLLQGFVGLCNFGF